MMYLKFMACAAAAALLSACGGSSTPSQQFSTKGLTVPSSRCAINPQSVGVAEEIDDIDGPRTCGVRNAWRIQSMAGIQFNNTATVTCGMVKPVNDWLENAVQPAARGAFGEKVVAVNVAASYSCRARNNRRGAKMSEHGYGNALDISSFTLASGRVVDVKHGWNGSSDERRFLRQARANACDEFRTVLGPGSDSHHNDHLHMDMQARTGGKYCR
jgi:hypothetical protein